MDIPIANLILYILFFGVAATYPLRALLLEKKDLNHEGPFASEYRWVFHVEDSWTQRVALFDWIRRLFGVYEVSKSTSDPRKEIWKVVPGKAARFECPFCLSWWVCVPFTGLFAHITRIDPILIPVAHCAIATISQVVYRHLFD